MQQMLKRLGRSMETQLMEVVVAQLQSMETLLTEAMAEHTRNMETPFMEVTAEQTRNMETPFMEVIKKVLYQGCKAEYLAKKMI